MQVCPFIIQHLHLNVSASASVTMQTPLVAAIIEECSEGVILRGLILRESCPKLMFSKEIDPALKM